MIKTSQTNRKIVCVLMCVCCVCDKLWSAKWMFICKKRESETRRSREKQQQQQQTDWIY